MASMNAMPMHQMHPAFAYGHHMQAMGMHQFGQFADHFGAAGMLDAKTQFDRYGIHQ